MTDQESQYKYDTWHDQMNFGVPQNPLNFPWYKSAFSDIRKLERGEFLEIGCGRGEFSIWLAGNMPSLKITAIDFSERAIEIGSEHAKVKNIDVAFKQDDAQSLSFSDNSFDYIVSCECIEHVLKPRKMVSEMFRVLRPGGRFCLTTENYLNGMMMGWLHSRIMKKPFNSGSGVQPHENLFFFWMISKYVRSSGLVLERTESCHLQWLLLPRVDPARLCTEHFSSPWSRFLAKPFGRHYSFFGFKPS